MEARIDLTLYVSIDEEDAEAFGFPDPTAKQVMDMLIENAVYNNTWAHPWKADIRQSAFRADDGSVRTLLDG